MKTTYFSNANLTKMDFLSQYVKINKILDPPFVSQKLSDNLVKEVTSSKNYIRIIPFSPYQSPLQLNNSFIY